MSGLYWLLGVLLRAHFGDGLHRRHWFEPFGDLGEPGPFHRPGAKLCVLVASSQRQMFRDVMRAMKPGGVVPVNRAMLRVWVGGFRGGRSGIATRGFVFGRRPQGDVPALTAAVMLTGYAVSVGSVSLVSPATGRVATFLIRLICLDISMCVGSEGQRGANRTRPDG